MGKQMEPGQRARLQGFLDEGGESPEILIMRYIVQ